jgi:hypothetical protein
MDFEISEIIFILNLTEKFLTKISTFSQLDFKVISKTRCFTNDAIWHQWA